MAKLDLLLCCLPTINNRQRSPYQTPYGNNTTMSATSCTHNPSTRTQCTHVVIHPNEARHEGNEYPALPTISMV
ncbi:hypothetical protein RB195_025576 [Necator americanus]|uniref:Uncharacterized protein n=1 Tax=Necator americanus TaxID=51031 RepID=A0ABR1ESY4_NECAM